MATLFACDATGKTVKHKDDLVEIGVRGRLYCEGVAADMRAYTDAVDKLHDECAEKFRDGLAALRAEYRKKLAEDGKLPDE